jgi:hypothetical protein
MTGSADSLVTALRRLSAVTMEMHDGWAGVRAGSRLVARIDLRHDRALVYAPADTIPTLRGLFPSARPAPGGIVFDLTEPGASSEAQRAVRRRVKVERLLPQFRDASP